MGLGVGSLVGALLGAVFFFLVLYSGRATNYSFLHDATTAPSVSYYDYIIVGGGTAGCPLAATLSQNYNVLLLERGGSPYGNPNITNLSDWGNLFVDHSSTSPAQQFISEDGVFNARARVLGGGTCINGGFYTRASADFVKTVGWNQKLVKDSYRWVEKLIIFKPLMLQWQSAVREGLLEAGVAPDNGFTYDHNLGTKVGGTIFDRDGHRHTAADLLQHANPEGLTVLLKATVHRILFRTKGRSKPVAHGVVFTDTSGAEHKAYLKKGPRNEIILAAGALGSPQLLMLSGVGPAAHLRSHNITVVLDQPMVGQGMSDNPLNGIVVPSPSDVEISLPQVVGITKYGSFIETVSGLRTPISYGMFKPQTKEEASSMSTEKRISEARANVFHANISFRGGLIFEKVAGPLSRGHLELKNRNASDNPSVTFNYFKNPSDLKRCVAGVEIVSRVIESEAFSKFTYPNISIQELIKTTVNLPLNLRPKHENASFSLEKFCRDSVMTIWHYHGGCQVGKVVDHNYKVLGVDALRVVDGSTFHKSPGTNPQATVMMLGRYVGVKILNQRFKLDESRYVTSCRFQPLGSI